MCSSDLVLAAVAEPGTAERVDAAAADEVDAEPMDGDQVDGEQMDGEQGLDAAPAREAHGAAAGDTAEVGRVSLTGTAEVRS